MGSYCMLGASGSIQRISGRGLLGIPSVCQPTPYGGREPGGPWIWTRRPSNNGRDIQSNRLQELVLNSIAECGCLRDLSRISPGAVEVQLIDDVLERTIGLLLDRVVGEFKRGKSTFINALLARRSCPRTHACSATAPGSPTAYSLRSRSCQGGRKDGGWRRSGRATSDFVTKLTPESEQTAAQVKGRWSPILSNICGSVWTSSIRRG